MKLVNIETGEELIGEIKKISSSELGKLKSNKNFTFDWSIEVDYDVYFVRQRGKKTLLGLISLIDYSHEFRVHINLIESRKNQRGKIKTIGNIPGCLIAFACKESFKKGYGGFVSLMPKTQLIPYYEKYGFVEVGLFMAIAGEDAKSLISKYFEDEEI